MTHQKHKGKASTCGNEYAPLTTSEIPDGYLVIDTEVKAEKFVNALERAEIIAKIEKRIANLENAQKQHRENPEEGSEFWRMAILELIKAHEQFLNDLKGETE